MHKLFVIALVALLVVVAATTSFFAADRTEYAYVTQFGRHVATSMMAPPTPVSMSSSLGRSSPCNGSTTDCRSSTWPGPSFLRMIPRA